MDEVKNQEQNIEHDPHLFVSVGNGEKKTKFVVTGRGEKAFKTPKKTDKKVSKAVQEEYLNRAKSTPLPDE